MKNIFFLSVLFSLLTLSHGASKGDFEGTWRLVEFALDEQYSDVPNPTPIKMYMNGQFILIYYLGDNVEFNKGKYILENGTVTETITMSSIETLIGESYKFKPNFMGDKNSFYKEIDFVDFIQFERWEKTKCDAIKCAKIRTRNN